MSAAADGHVRRGGHGPDFGKQAYLPQADLPAEAGSNPGLAT